MNSNNSLMMEHNRNEVRELVENAQSFGNGVYVVTDLSDNRIYVDTVSGLTARMLNVRDLDGSLGIEYKWYGNGETSEKSNGYVYTPLNIHNTKGNIYTHLCGTHTLVCMLKDKEGYDELVNNRQLFVTNHMNNLSWDNRAENLEWATVSENVLHGRFIKNIFRYYGDAYTHMQYNLGVDGCIVMNQTLSVHHINDYIEEIGGRENLRMNRAGLIDEENILNFLKMQFIRGYWV